MGEKQQNGLVEWEEGLCSCDSCSSCLWAWCWPCGLMGVTKARLEDPDVNRHADDCCNPNPCCTFNSDCLANLASTIVGVGACFVWYRRHQLRKDLGVDGGMCTDCLASCFCTPCALTQHDNHVRKTTKGGIVRNQPGRVQGMNYN